MTKSKIQPVTVSNLKKKGISVIGLGKLGLPMAVCFAKAGFKTTGVDIDIERIEKINKGISPIEETGLSEFMKETKDNLTATNNYEEAIENSSVSFIVVATPSLADGSFSNEYLEKVLNKIGKVLKKKKEYHLVVITSTVMPQTTEKISKFLLEEISGKKCGKNFGIAYNPEFIALGNVIRDFLNPDFILIGEMNRKDGDMLAEIYRETCKNNPHFARMTPLNAEIAKITLNCYITTKITFANSLAAICEKVKGADAHRITEALGFDSRIGSKYLKPGLGYGGPCFPRDNLAFSAFAQQLEMKAKLLKIVDEVNQDQVSRVVKRIIDILSGLGKDRRTARIGILGLSYKPNTPVIEDSHAIKIVQLLVNEKYQVSVYDPQAMESARSILGHAVKYAKSKEDCLSGDLAVITVPWEEFKNIDFKAIKKNIVLLDCWGFLRGRDGLDIRYLGTG